MRSNHAWTQIHPPRHAMQQYDRCCKDSHLYNEPAFSEFDTNPAEYVKNPDRPRAPRPVPDLPWFSHPWHPLHIQDWNEPLPSKPWLWSMDHPKLHVPVKI